MRPRPGWRGYAQPFALLGNPSGVTKNPRSARALRARRATEAAPCPAENRRFLIARWKKMEEVFHEDLTGFYCFFHAIRRILRLLREARVQPYHPC